jgi:argininosuccinate lyase
VERQADKTSLRRDPYGLGAIAGTQFREHRANVEFDRALGYRQRSGDLFVSTTLRD